MKVGILTFHRAHNYGAVLQCYALQHVITNMRHKVEVIDYRQPTVEYDYNLISLKRIKSFRNLLGYIYHFHERYRIVRKKRKIFDSFRKRFLNMSRKCTSNNLCIDYDVIIIGSDQLWNKYCIGKKFDPIYWGDFQKNSNTKIIGYAISSNKQSIKEISEKYIDKLDNFYSLSLREPFAIEELSSKTKKELYHCIDPTLLTEADFWNPLINKKYKDRKFIALYQVRHFNQREVLEEKAKHLADKYGYEVIDLSSISYSVGDFLSVIKYAKCVMTSSFHATVFSIIFGTPFYAFRWNDSSDDRYVNLLYDLGLKECIVDVSCLPDKINKIDKQSYITKLKEYKKASLLYLKNTLNMCDNA